MGHRLYNGGHEEGWRDEEGDGHEEGKGDGGGLRAEEPGRFQEAFAHQMLACRCGYSAGHGRSCCEAGGLMVAWSSLCIVLLVRLVAHLHGKYVCACSGRPERGWP